MIGKRTHQRGDFGSKSLAPLSIHCTQFRFRRKFWKWRERSPGFAMALVSNRRFLNLSFDL